jgi:L-cysteine desulfidase
MDKTCYDAYLRLLHRELVPAMGCTEPIAVAYAAALAARQMPTLPTQVHICVSGNIIKNVKSVVVPNTGGLRGIAAAVCAGVVAGKPEKELEVISTVSEEERARLRQFMKTAVVDIRPSDAELVFVIHLLLHKGEDTVEVRIVNHHTNVVFLRKNDEILLELPVEESSEDNLTDKSCLSIEKIVEFADVLEIDDVREVVGRQIAYNMAIAEAGLEGDWGANIGSVILAQQGKSLEKRACAYAAAGSDARMSGCEKPVIIVSGSGNQGITASVPVAVVAQELGKTEEQLLKAVALSDLVTIHQKTGIGRLSAYCGAISAGCGAGAGIAYLLGGDARAVAHTVVNAVAILSGTICDGAKPSCAAKIAMAVEAGIMGYEMTNAGYQFYGGDGIVTKGVENTIRNIGRLARDGMSETDREIIRIMLEKHDC